MFLNGCAGDAGPLDPVRDTVEATVAQIFNILPEDFGSMSRGPARVALARQVAMYITHVACRLTLTDVGRLYARDRTTVSHACGVIEDLRDDATFDRVLDLVEMIVRFRLRTIVRGQGE
jgi:chromosomal replication initiation ATPase DnaA